MSFPDRRWRIGSREESAIVAAIGVALLAASAWLGTWALIVGIALVVLGGLGLHSAIRMHRRYTGHEPVIRDLWEMATAWPANATAYDEATGRQITVERRRGSRTIVVTDPVSGPEAVDPVAATVSRYRIGEGWAPVPPPLYRHITGANDPTPNLKSGGRPPQLSLTEFLAAAPAAEVELNELLELRSMLRRLFRPATKAGEVREEESDATARDLQSVALDLAEAVEPYDSAMLARASAQQRLAQVHGRQVLYDFADALWDDIKARGLHKMDDKYASVRGLRDLTQELLNCAKLACRNAGEDVDAWDYDPEAARSAEAKRKAAFTRWLETATLDQLRAAQATANPSDINRLAAAIERHPDTRHEWG